MKRRRKKKYAKTCSASITKEMWVDLQELKVHTHMSKAAIIRMALEEFKNNHA